MKFEQMSLPPDMHSTDEKDSTKNFPAPKSIRKKVPLSAWVEEKGDLRSLDADNISGTSLKSEENAAVDPEVEHVSDQENHDGVNKLATKLNGSFAQKTLSTKANKTKSSFKENETTNHLDNNLMEGADDKEPEKESSYSSNSGSSENEEIQDDNANYSNKRKKNISWEDQRQVSSSLKNEENGVETDEFEDDEYFDDIYNFGDLKQFYGRIFGEWSEQDKLMSKASTTTSNIVWIPLLLMLRIANIILKIFYLSINFFPDFIVPLVETNFDFSYAKQNFISSKSSQNFMTKFEMPLNHRKETAIVFFFMSLIPLISVSFFTTLALLIFPLTTIPIILYLVYIFKIDKSPQTGSRIAFLRYSSVWRHFVNYFPIRMVKTYNLDPNDNYVFCYHPHGIISFGAFGNFGTDATGFSRLFPGIDLRLLTLSINFKVPFLRELLLSMGICSCAKKSCVSILNRKRQNYTRYNSSSSLVEGHGIRYPKGKKVFDVPDEDLNKPRGNGIMLVVGGAEESLLSVPGTYRLNVNSRKGFVRVALETGASLVPVLGFGETDAFSTQIAEPNTFLYSLQRLCKRTFGFTTPLFWGRSIVDKSNPGVLPHRTPIIAVVGKPLKMPKLPPDFKLYSREGKQLVNKMHRKYIKALKVLYDAFKDKWAINRSESMILVPNPRALSDLESFNNSPNINGSPNTKISRTISSGVQAQ